MIKVGDKVKFSQYIPKNYLTGHYLKKTLDNVPIFAKRYVVVWSESVVHYNTNMLNTEIREGTYVGTFRKKLSRIYRRSASLERVPLTRTIATTDRDEDPFWPRAVDPEPRVRRVDRYSSDPARLDNPRQLTKMAMINYRGKLLGVPMINVYKCTFKDIIKTL